MQPHSKRVWLVLEKSRRRSQYLSHGGKTAQGERTPSKLANSATKDPGKQPGELAAAISNMVVAVYADHLGRGPTRARSYINGRVITCLLEDTLTRAEAKLLAAGRRATVLELRCSFQETMRGELITGMERVSGRSVQALMGAVQLEPAEVSTQVFLLDGGERSD
jgi:uncharacterized protein YbcI